MKPSYEQLEAKVADLERQLGNCREDWICGECEGKGCEAMRQNTILLEEMEEQAKLHGKGSEREARLIAKVAELERENAALKQRCETCETAAVIDSYVRENAALRADKERLDWLQKHKVTLCCWRAAIDAAREEKQ